LTDNWGYFKYAYDTVKSIPDSYWKDYDVFLMILITVGVCTVIWLIVGGLHIYALCTAWNDFITYGVWGFSLAFLIFMGANGYIFYYIYQWHTDFSSGFEKCKCTDFQDNVYRSIKYYFFACCWMGAWSLIQLLVVICSMCCCGEEPKKEEPKIEDNNVKIEIKA